MTNLQPDKRVFSYPSPRGGRKNACRILVNVSASLQQRTSIGIIQPLSYGHNFQSRAYGKASLLHATRCPTWTACAPVRAEEFALQLGKQNARVRRQARIGLAGFLLISCPITSVHLLKEDVGLSPLHCALRSHMQPYPKSVCSEDTVSRWLRRLFG